ncbi:MAG: PP2C family protein-serine/threonine phosphatase [Planctomycetota bacterium]|nr:PP2C family protein-serine/threonine phosphatase [Planctomycetota bacterium]
MPTLESPEIQRAQVAPDRADRTLACMEIWGGHDGFRGWVSTPGNDVLVSSVPHVGAAQGGDVYYVSNCAAGKITRFVLADVAGHGSEVASLARQLRDQVRRHINKPDQRRLARGLNASFASLSAASPSAGSRFATAILATYFSPTKHLVICNAGHPSPLWYRAEVGSWSLIRQGEPGVTSHGTVGVGLADLPLGVVDDTSYTQLAVTLDPGDLVVLYSDAFIEARGVRPPHSSVGPSQMLGEQGLLEFVRSLDPSRPDQFEAAFREGVAGGSPLDDDATAIVLRHHGQGPPRQSLMEKASTLARRLGL